ncbi:MAG: hypothetical protein V7K14_01305, partial [Nostoc sp.]|uniref:hypothetical protein n=1 Tax=Nostoc sp. TaxID=1180 RepID=UPI002FF47FB9
LIDKTRPIFFYHKLLLSLSHKLFSLFCRPVSLISLHAIASIYKSHYADLYKEKKENIATLLT